MVAAVKNFSNCMMRGQGRTPEQTELMLSAATCCRLNFVQYVRLA